MVRVTAGGAASNLPSHGNNTHPGRIVNNRATNGNERPDGREHRGAGGVLHGVFTQAANTFNTSKDILKYNGHLHADKIENYNKIANKIVELKNKPPTINRQKEIDRLEYMLSRYTKPRDIKAAHYIDMRNHNSHKVNNAVENIVEQSNQQNLELDKNLDKFIVLTDELTKLRQNYNQTRENLLGILESLAESVDEGLKKIPSKYYTSCLELGRNMKILELDINNLEEIIQERYELTAEDIRTVNNNAIDIKKYRPDASSIRGSNNHVFLNDLLSLGDDLHALNDSKYFMKQEFTDKIGNYIKNADHNKNSTREGIENLLVVREELIGNYRAKINEINSLERRIQSGLDVAVAASLSYTPAEKEFLDQLEMYLDVYKISGRAAVTKQANI